MNALHRFPLPVQQTGLTDGWCVLFFIYLSLLIVVTVTQVVTAVLPKCNEYLASICQLQE